MIMYLHLMSLVRSVYTSAMLVINYVYKHLPVQQNLFSTWLKHDNL